MKKKVNPCWFTAAFIAVMVFFNMASLGAVTFTVSSTADGGTGSLRAAIIDANNTAGADEIVFTGFSGTITLWTPLPNLTDNAGLNIRGNTASGFVANSSASGGLNGALTVTILGSSTSDVILRILSDNNTIRGLNFQHPSGAFHTAKIYIEGGSNNLIAGCYIGTNIAGTAPDGSQGMGVFITGGTGNQVGLVGASNRNLISGNSESNVVIYQANTTSVYGNIIGLRANGTTAMGSNGVGVLVFESSNCNVGAGFTATRNIISGNDDGVTIHSGTGNKVRGNYIGMDHTGTTIVPGQRYGVLITKGSSGNFVGGDAAGQGNLISGNITGVACIITGPGGNTIWGNTIGPQLNGTSNVTGNTQTIGVLIDDSPSHIIGGNTTLKRNVISANLDAGIKLRGVTALTTGTIVQGNYIGLDKNGTSFISSSSQNYGIEIAETAKVTTIGGASVSERNVISGNSDAGIFCNGTDGNGSKIVNNLIGTQANGMNIVPLSHQDYGIKLNAANFTIGGNVQVRNIISANATAGIHITGFISTNNVIKGNYIGTNEAGTSIIPSASQDYGVEIVNDASLNRVGSTILGEGNVISGNTEWGVNLQSANTAANRVLNNIIGLQANGVSNLASSSQNYGVFIKNSPNNTIGGSNAGERNIISGNTSIGVYIQSAGSTGNKVKGNFIGPDITGTALVVSSTQSRGIMVDDYASDCIIGGTQATDANVISGNLNTGIRLFAPTALGNKILGNIIGPQSDGVTRLANSVQENGIWVHYSSNNTIGGAADGAANIIAYHLMEGVVVEDGSSTRNLISRNSFFCNSDIPGGGFAGILRLAGGNPGVNLPGITVVNGSGIQGTAQPGATIEVFQRDLECSKCEGRRFLGTANADPQSGVWSFSSSQGPFAVTATLNNTTSQFNCWSPDFDKMEDRNEPSIDTETISIYPNPSNGTFQIVGFPQENALKQSSTGALAVYNAVGERVHLSEISQSGTEITLDVPPGLYFYVLTSEGQAIKNGKIIIQ